MKQLVFWFNDVDAQLTLRVGPIVPMDSTGDELAGVFSTDSGFPTFAVCLKPPAPLERDTYFSTLKIVSAAIRHSRRNTITKLDLLTTTFG